MDIAVVDRLGTVMGEVEEALRRSPGMQVVPIDSVHSARQMGSSIIRAAGQRPGTIGTLRFYSHGGPGAQGVYTRYSNDVVGDGARAMDSALDGNLASRASNAFIREGTITSGFGFYPGMTHPRVYGLDLIGSYFRVGGCAELHGCAVADGEIGRQFVQSCADMWGVTVMAGEQSQLHTGSRLYRFEGPVVRCMPRRWARPS